MFARGDVFLREAGDANISRLTPFKISILTNESQYENADIFPIF